MTKWIERYRQQAQKRYDRLDAVLAEMHDEDPPISQEPPARSSVMNTINQRYQVSIEADPDLPIIHMTSDFDATPAQLIRAHTDLSCSLAGSAPTGRPSRSSTGTPPTAAVGAMSAGSTARSTASAAASTRSVRTTSSRPSPSTACPTASASRRCGSRTSAAARPADVQSLVDSFEGRDQWLASGMETGVEQGYAKLDALVAELR